MNRRKFINQSFSAYLGWSLANSYPVSENKKLPITFDLHCHPGRIFALGTKDAGDPSKTISDMNAGQLSGAFFALVADAGIISVGATGVNVTGKYQSGEGWHEYKRQLNEIKAYLHTSGIHQSIYTKDLKSKKLQAYLSVEGGDFLEGSIERIDEAYHDGIRSIQLVHYAPNDLGDLQTAAVSFNGLSDFGKNTVKKMNTIGMLIDVAHASYETTKAVSDITSSPIMLSHSILAMEPDRPIGRRAITKEHAIAVAKTGGIIGAWPSGFNKSFDEYGDNVLRLIDAVGIDHVSIGTDMDANFKPVLDNYRQLSDLKSLLVKKGLHDHEADQVLGGNAERVMKKVIG